MQSLITQNAAVEITIQTVLDSLDSAHSRRAYERHLRKFIAWHQATDQPELNKATVQRYAAELRDSGVSAATINQRLSAIRKLAAEASDNGALDAQIASGIKAIKGVRQEGSRTGNWLAKQQAQQLLRAPDTSTRKVSVIGLSWLCCSAVVYVERKRLALVSITSSNATVDGFWWISSASVTSLRSVPMPAWTKAAIDAYAANAELAEGILFRPINKGGRATRERMTEQAIYNVVLYYANKLSVGKIAPHDLRRTFAKLAHKGGSGVDQIQLSLGHGSIQTTERYLGIDQDLTDAPCDHLGLRL